jgi:DNA-binding beta-propeller fold protein YncE
MDLQSGAVTLLAGYPGHLGSTDGTGTGALFNQPVGLAIDDSGTYLYVADLQNSTIRRVEIATGMVTTIAGKAGYNHSADGVGTAASFNRPWAITLRGTSLYIADTMSHIIRKLDLATNEVTTVAGTVGVPGYDNGTGTGSKFNWPRGIAADSTSIYVSDTYNKAIRVIQ